MALSAKKSHDVVTLQASGAQNATGQGSSVRLPGLVNALCFTLDVTSAAAAAGDTLDVTVQTKLDGNNWVDVVAFTQVLGNGGTKRYHAKVCADSAQAEFEASAALGAGNVRHLLGDEWRAAWTIAGTTPAFTFSVTALPM